MAFAKPRLNLLPSAAYSSSPSSRSPSCRSPLQSFRSRPASTACAALTAAGPSDAQLITPLPRTHCRASTEATCEVPSTASSRSASSAAASVLSSTPPPVVRRPAVSRVAARSGDLSPSAGTATTARPSLPRPHNARGQPHTRADYRPAAAEPLTVHQPAPACPATLSPAPPASSSHRSPPGAQSSLPALLARPPSPAAVLGRLNDRLPSAGSQPSHQPTAASSSATLPSSLPLPSYRSRSSSASFVQRAVDLTASVSAASLSSAALTFHELTDSASDEDAEAATDSDASDGEEGSAGGQRHLTAAALLPSEEAATAASVRRVSLQERSNRSLTPILTQRTRRHVLSPSLDDTVTSSASASLPLSSVSWSPASAAASTCRGSPLPSPSPQPLSPDASAPCSYPSAMRRPLGLDNLGNTCLLSVPRVLGFFSSCLPSVGYLRDLNEGVGRSGGQLAKSFAALCAQLAVPPPSSAAAPSAARSAQLGSSAAGSGSVSPSSLLRSFTRLEGSFGDRGQHDSQELLRCFVSALHDDVNRVRRQPPYEQLDARPGESEWQQGERWWANYTARNSSVVTDLFAGQLRSEVRCLECRRQRVAFDPFLDLSLPLPARAHEAAAGAADDAVSLADCFGAFMASERLTGQDAIYCPHCKAHCSSTKALSLHRLPAVLVLHVKRFDFNSRGGRRKLDSRIAAPLSINLQMSSGADKNKSALHPYKLVAAINHIGSAQSGHYIAHATIGHDWYRFNDSHAQLVDGAQVATQHIHSAYVLFYHTTAAH